MNAHHLMTLHAPVPKPVATSIQEALTREVAHGALLQWWIAADPELLPDMVVMVVLPEE